MTANRGNPGYTFFERPYQPLSPDHLSNDRPTPEDGRERFTCTAARIPTLPDGIATSCSSVFVVVNRLEPPLARGYLIVCDMQRRVHG
jgi:hypothetical protein